MEVLIALYLSANHSLTGAELIQYCRDQRAETLMITNSEYYADSVYMECLVNE